MRIIDAYSPVRPSHAHGFDPVWATCLSIFGVYGIVRAIRIIQNPKAHLESLRNWVERLEMGYVSHLDPVRRESKILALRTLLSSPNPTKKIRTTWCSIIVIILLFEFMAWNEMFSWF